MTTLFGIDRLLADPALRKPLEGQRVALLAHPASVTAELPHSLAALAAAGVNVSAVFGPQHGVRGDLPDTMMASHDLPDPKSEERRVGPGRLSSFRSRGTGKY